MDILDILDTPLQCFHRPLFRTGGSGFLSFFFSFTDIPPQLLCIGFFHSENFLLFPSFYIYDVGRGDFSILRSSASFNELWTRLRLVEWEYTGWDFSLGFLSGSWTLTLFNLEDWLIRLFFFVL